MKNKNVEKDTVEAGPDDIYKKQSPNTIPLQLHEHLIKKKLFIFIIKSLCNL